jgi:hypothetical protein
MRIAGTTHIRQNVEKIQARIKEAEKKLMLKEWGTDQFFGNVYIPLDGPRDPAYQGTPVFRSLEYLDKLSLPQRYQFVDLGSGLGAACYGAAEHFERVTGYENNQLIFEEAENIRSESGIDNVRFINTDFMRISLSPFRVVFFFRPFAENFFEEIRPKLLETEPGTYIISRQFRLPEIFDESNFSLLEKLARQEEKDFPNFPFYAYLRR